MSLPYESSVPPTGGDGQMTRRDIAGLACRIIAVYLLTQAVLSLAGGAVATLFGIASMISRGRTEFEYFFGSAVYILPGIGSGLAGWFLWAKSVRIAARMVPDEPVSISLGSVTAADLLSIALSISGVFVTLNAVAYIVRNFALITAERNFSYWRSTSSWNQTFWSAVVELALGIWLIFGSRGIAAIIRKLRHQDPPGSPTPPTQE